MRLASFQLGRPLDAVRRMFGFVLLTMGLIGAVLPLCPGLPWFLAGVVILGRRDRTLRRLHLLWRYILRWVRGMPWQPVRQLGLWVTREYVRARRFITPLLIAVERPLWRPSACASDGDHAPICQSPSQTPTPTPAAIAD